MSEEWDEHMRKVPEETRQRMFIRSCLGEDGLGWSIEKFGNVYELTSPGGDHFNCSNLGEVEQCLITHDARL